MVEHVAWCWSKVLLYKAACVFLTVLENAQYCWDAIMHRFILLGKQETLGEGSTTAIHMQMTRKQHISLYFEKGQGIYTAYTMSTFK